MFVRREDDTCRRKKKSRQLRPCSTFTTKQEQQNMLPSIQLQSHVIPSSAKRVFPVVATRFRDILSSFRLQACGATNKIHDATASRRAATTTTSSDHGMPQQQVIHTFSSTQILPSTQELPSSQAYLPIDIDISSQSQTFHFHCEYKLEVLLNDGTRATGLYSSPRPTF